MNKGFHQDIIWIVSEIGYYFGLVFAALLIPLLTLALWTLDMTGKLEPNYWYLLVSWVLAVLLFLVGVLIKNRIYSK